MDNLIKNLRNLAAFAHGDVSFADEAADEIERLHAENRQLRKALGKIMTLHWFAVPAEIARAALGEEEK